MNKSGTDRILVEMGMDLIDRLRSYASTRKGELAELITEAADTLVRQSCEDAVSRAAVIDVLRTCYDTETITYDNGNEYINYEQAVELVENLATTQPEITRCKDCRYWLPGYLNQEGFTSAKCRKYQQMVGHSHNDFCSYAERRTDERE